LTKRYKLTQLIDESNGCSFEFLSVGFINPLGKIIGR